MTSADLLAQTATLPLGESIGAVAPLYNLVLVAVAIALFLKLFSLREQKGIHLRPWKYLYAAVMIYIVEEVLTVLDKVGALSSPRILNVFFEFAIIILFIYLLLLQKNHLEHES